MTFKNIYIYYLHLENCRIIHADVLQKRANCIRQILLQDGNWSSSVLWVMSCVYISVCWNIVELGCSSFLVLKVWTKPILVTQQQWFFFSPCDLITSDNLQTLLWAVSRFQLKQRTESWLLVSGFKWIIKSRTVHPSKFEVILQFS